MKRLLTNPDGGFPLTLSDFRWITAGLFESTLGIVSTVCNPENVVILSGCERSIVGTTVTVTAGWITIGGEVFRVNEHTFENATSLQEFWSFDELFDPEGLKVYANSVSHDTYSEKVYKVVTGAPPVDATEYSLTKTYNQLVTSNLVRDTWHLFKQKTFSSGSAFGAVTFELYCKHDIDGFVHIQGDMGFEDEGSGAVNVLVGTLPVGYRPTTKREVVLSTQINNVTGEIGNAFLEIATNGEIRIKSLFVGFAVKLDFSSIQPFQRVP